MIPIGMDARMMRHTGIGTYIKNILRGFHRNHYLKNYQTTLYTQLQEPSFLDYPSKNFKSKIYGIPEQLEYPAHLMGNDLWHAPHYNVPLLRGKTKLVVTIHDIIHWVYR